MASNTVVRLSFGKYKGRPVENVPKEYLLWALEHVPDYICPVTKQEIDRVLRKWQGMERQKR